MAKRRIRWDRLIIVTLIFLSILYVMRPETTGKAVDITISDNTTNETGTKMITDPYTNMTRPGHHNFSALFGYEIMFMGYDINETILRPNETFEITYYWKALDKMDKDYVVFVHFTDNNNRILFQQDHMPPLQTSRWSPGDIINETYTIKVPENVNGTINLGLGWWYPPTGKRLDIQNIEQNDNKLIIGIIKSNI